VAQGLALDDDQRLGLARCLLLGGEDTGVTEMLDALLHDDADPEAMVELGAHAAEHALAAGRAEGFSRWIEGYIPRFEAVFGVCYELRLLAFKLLAACPSTSERLLAGAQALIQANRKSARQDLSREPLWQVTGPPGELLDTATAAQRCGRSPAFIAKRLEARALPWCQQGEQVRIPALALAAWQAVMDAHKLLE